MTRWANRWRSRNGLVYDCRRAARASTAAIPRQPLAASEVGPGNPGDSRSRFRIPATSDYGVQLTAGPFVFSFPGELQFTM